MIRVAVLALCASGCQLVFDVEPPGSTAVQHRHTFTASAPLTDRFVFDGADEIQAGDTLIALVHARNTDTIVMESNPGWTPLVDEEARGCATEFHAWFLKTVASAETTFDFTFDLADDMAAVVSAYSNAGSATLIDLLLEDDEPDRVVSFPAISISPGSVVWLGGIADRPWAEVNDPSGTKRQGAIGNVAVYDMAVVDGQVPQIDIAAQSGFCVDIGAVKIEP